MTFGTTTSLMKLCSSRRMERIVLVHLNKSGFVFVIDRANGNLQNIWRLSETINFVKDIDPKDRRADRPRGSPNG